MRYRIEKDSLGEKQIPAEAYYGIHTLRGKENFEITKRGISRQMIKALAIVKKSAAQANNYLGLLDDKISKAIMLSADEILNGRLHGQFITDLIQGGAGVNMDMNANEILANRANEMLGGKKGVYDLVDPIVHVNMNQTTDDVIPTVGKIAVIRQTKKLLVEVKKLVNALALKSKELSFNRISLSFEAFGVAFNKAIKRIEASLDDFLEINIGTLASNVDPKFAKKMVSNISKYTGEDFRSPKNINETTKNLDCFSLLSSNIKLLAVLLCKVTNDLMLLIGLHSDQENDVIIPSIQDNFSNQFKIDTSIFELVNQVSYYCIGADATIIAALDGNQIRFNAYLPVVLSTLFDALNYVRRAIRTFREKAVEKVYIKEIEKAV